MAPVKRQKKRQQRRRELRISRSFSHVVPLGSTCLIARHLENKGMRIGKFPFDWIFSTPYMVRHALLDNFKSFLDPKQYDTKGTRDGGVKDGTHHKVYHLMQETVKRKVVFPHEQLWHGAPNFQADRDSYGRAVQRFRGVLKSKLPEARTLFVMAITLRSAHALDVARDDTWCPSGRGKCPIPEVGGPELSSRAEILRLFEVLQLKTAGRFHLEVVYLVTPKASKKRPGKKCVLKKQGQKGRSLRITEVYCKGDNTGLVFPEEADMLNFHQVLTESGQRTFSLSSESSKRRDATSELISGNASKVNFKRPQWLKRKVQFVQKNPKVNGSLAHQRYEKYKKAKTLQEFLDLGGFQGDFHNDRKHGYVSLRR